MGTFSAQCVAFPYGKEFQRTIWPGKRENLGRIACQSAIWPGKRENLGRIACQSVIWPGKAGKVGKTGL